MTAAVRLFTFSGLTTIPVVSGKELRQDSVQAFKYPILGRDLLSCSTGAADSSEAASAPANTGVAWVQIENGKRVHIEIAPENHTLTEASNTSPIIEGNHSFPFGPSWRISVLEAT
jgi:hypothetical protein